jgi:hypothetical protein
MRTSAVSSSQSICPSPFLSIRLKARRKLSSSCAFLNSSRSFSRRSLSAAICAAAMTAQCQRARMTAAARQHTSWFCFLRSFADDMVVRRLRDLGRWLNGWPAISSQRSAL